MSRSYLNIGDIVRLRVRKTEGVLPEEWTRSGIILDIMDMTDGFPMVEVCFGTSIQWFQDLELESVQR